MENIFSVGIFSVIPGAKKQGWLPVIGSEERLPVTLINGSKPGKTAVITAGTHGGEYPGIEAAIRLAAMLDPAEVSGRIAIVHCLNQASFFAKTQYYNPIDGVNLNRVFPGRPLGSHTERLAYTISSQFFSQADIFLDLHSGDIHENLTDFVIYPKIGSSEQIAVSKEMASLLGVPYVVGSLSETGSIGSAAKIGVSGILGEIGCLGRWTEEQVERYIHGVSNILRYAGILAGEVVRQDCTYMQRMVGVNVPQSGIWHPLVEPGQSVYAGQELGEIVDLFGKTTEKISSPSDGIMLYVISSLAVTQGEALLAVGEPE